MIDTATGMKPGERYSVGNIEREHPFSGFFLDGKYYLGPELLTAVGWLEGQRFIYDQLDPAGEPVYPDRVAGTITALTLTLVDGASLQLAPIAADSFVERAGPADPQEAEQADPVDSEEPLPEPEPEPENRDDATAQTADAAQSRHRAKRILALAAIAILSTCVVALLRRERR